MKPFWCSLLVGLCASALMAQSPLPNAATRTRLQCADPAVKPLQLTKTLVNGTGTLSLQTTVCNIGTADYSSRVPLVATLIVQTWHPPRTAAQEGDTKEASRTPIGTLNKGECRNITITYQVPSVASWEELASRELRLTRMAPSRGKQVEAVKQLTVRAEKTPSIGKGFTALENCDTMNDAASVTVKYLERVR